MINLLYLFFMMSFSVSSVSFLYFLYENILFYKLEEEREELIIEDNDDISLKKEEIKYEDKYLPELKILLETKKNIEEIDLTTFSHLKNNIIMEKTPIGNVAMYFDYNSEAFTYYSDSSIPYRFLEVVARKYVLTYQCIDIFIDMENEVECIEKRRLEMEETSKRKEEEKKTYPIVHEKKNVFTKFKNYNKEGMSGRVNSAPPPKNNIGPTSASYNPLLLKEKANRYVCKGRFSSFPILKQIDRKKIDKEYTLRYSEFKKNSLKNLS